MVKLSTKGEGSKCPKICPHVLWKTPRYATSLIAYSSFLGRRSLMAGLRIPFQFFGKSDYPPFLSQSVPFSFTSFFLFFINIIYKWSHQGSPGVTKRASLGFPWVPLGSLRFPQFNIIDFTNHRPKMAAFSLKTFRLFHICSLLLNQN